MTYDLSTLLSMFSTSRSHQQRATTIASELTATTTLRHRRSRGSHSRNPLHKPTATWVF